VEESLLLLLCLALGSVGVAEEMAGRRCRNAEGCTGLAARSIRWDG